MKLTNKNLLLALVAGAAPLGLAFTPSQDKIDLTPRFEAGQSFTITQAVEMSGDIEEVSVTMDGTDVLGGAIEGGGEMTVTMTIMEEIKEVRDGKPSKMHVKLDEANMEGSGSIDAMGESETMDESMELPGVGHTAEITISEDGEIEREDITEDAEPLSDEELASIPHRNHFDILLPSEPVEEGKPFELNPDWDELMGEMMSSMDSAEMGDDEKAAMEAMMTALGDATEIDATGTVSGVEDGIATIEYEIEVTTTIDDLMELIKKVAPPEEAAQIPPADATLEMAAKMTGVGKFNLELGQMVELELGGEMTLDMSGAMEMGQAIDAAASMSGEFAMTATIEVN